MNSMGTTYTNLLFHIVFSTKYRKRFITPEVRERLYEYIGGMLREQKGILLQSEECRSMFTFLQN